MVLTKKDVQKRVLKGGKSLGLKLFDWDEVSRTFSSKECGLVLDFTSIDNINFNTRADCVFKTGNNCMFTTYSSCTFKTGNNCTFDTGPYCTFDTCNECVFTTNDSCIFKTGNKCTFTTSNYCVFKTGDNCVFSTFSRCTFKTSDSCTFDTGRYCMFDTGKSCTFKTRNNCTFDTGEYCTFDTDIDCVFVTDHSCNFHLDNNCTIITRMNGVVIKPDNGKKLTTCPMGVPGYLIHNDYYVNDVKQEGAYMLADGMLSKIISKKGNIFKVYTYMNYLNDFSAIPTYIVQDRDHFSHGETIKEARESLIYKISNRDKTAYENLTMDSVLSKEEAIKMYRVITGSCEYGVKNYVKSLTNVKDEYTIQEIVELTTSQYGNDELRKFFKI